jgi:preprotein translocase subunit SecA
MRRGIGLRGYAQQDPLNEFRREAFRMYEELRALIRQGVANSIFRVTVQRQQAPDAGLSRSLAAGAARLRAASGGNGADGGSNGAPPETAPPPAGAVRQPAAAVAGSAILRGALPSSPSVRNVTERVGETEVGGSIVGGADAGGTVGPRPGYTPTGERIGRNDPCWCGSGNKYKKCHGR